MTYCSVVAVLVLVSLTKKRFGQYAILKILSLRSPRNGLLHDLPRMLHRLFSQGLFQPSMNPGAIVVQIYWSSMNSCFFFTNMFPPSLV